MESASFVQVDEQTDAMFFHQGDDRLAHPFRRRFTVLRRIDPVHVAAAIRHITQLGRQTGYIDAGNRDNFSRHRLKRANLRRRQRPSRLAAVNATQNQRCRSGLPRIRDAAFRLPTGSRQQGEAVGRQRRRSCQCKAKNEY